jgi:hypothetical protein
MRGRWLWLNLCWIWLVVLTLYLIWGGITQRGLYYWVGTLEMDQFGSYDPKFTGIGIGFLFGLPALLALGAEAQRQRRLRPDPAAQVRVRRQAGLLMGGLGIAALAGAAACFIVAMGLPSGGGRPAPFDAAALGNGPPPIDMVSLTGTLDRNALASYADGDKGSAWFMTYTGFRAAGEADRSGPFRIFVERRVRNPNGILVPYAGNDESGFLIEDGLPSLMRYALERQGVRIATPHYLLRTDSGSLREPYYVGALLGLFFGCLLVAGAALLLFLQRRRVRGGLYPR